MFLRLAILDTGVSLCLTVPSNWTVFQLKQHLETGLHGLLVVDARSLQLNTATTTTDTGRRWILYNDADAIALLQHFVPDSIHRLLTTRGMDDGHGLCDYHFDDQLDAIHVLVRDHKVSRDSYTWMQAWLPWLSYACLIFTLTLMVAWLDTIVTWLHQCQSNWELVRNLPWVVLSATLFVAPIYTYVRDIAITQARWGYVEIA